MKKDLKYAEFVKIWIQPEKDAMFRVQPPAVIRIPEDVGARWLSSLEAYLLLAPYKNGKKL